MTDSEAMRHGMSKRERLVAGARQVIHQQGVEKTTIADIARAAGVPVGNVYYYFKTKDDLVDATIDSLEADERALLQSLERHRTPQGRLKALIRELTAQRDVVAQYGCPMGSLCSELDKREDHAERQCGRLLNLPVDWAEEQFRELGRRDARDLAVALLASYHGIALLTNTLRDPQLMAREARRLERWIDSLA
ncbi:MAG TPA: TetR/AcrR family transcriptional regulator [Solirubrobacteraceae bacterium]|nr:TetR/AcrR family transcriptional regulator [Solirubrobacteraceae bacterium]